MTHDLDPYYKTSPRGASETPSITLDIQCNRGCLNDHSQRVVITAHLPVPTAPTAAYLAPKNQNPTAMMPDELVWLAPVPGLGDLVLVLQTWPAAKPGHYYATVPDDHPVFDPEPEFEQKKPEPIPAVQGANPLPHGEQEQTAD